MENKNLDRKILKLLTKLFVFFIPITFGFFILFGFWLPMKYKNSGLSNIEKWRLLYEGGANSDIIIFGSSRALRGYNSTIISQKLNKTCYNFADLGIPLSNYPRFLHDYLLKNKPPETLIVSLDIFAFNYRDRISTPYRMLPFIHERSRIYNEIYQFRYIKYLKTYGYFYYKNIILQEMKTMQGQKQNLFGFEPLEWEWKNPTPLVKEAKAIKEYGLDSTKTHQYFSEINKLVQKYKIKKTYFILPPVYYSELHITGNWKKIVSFTQKECTKLNIELIDMLEDSISQNPNYYYDPIHFNSKGADIFTKKMIKELNKN